MVPNYFSTCSANNMIVLIKFGFKCGKYSTFYCKKLRTYYVTVDPFVLFLKCLTHSHLTLLYKLVLSEISVTSQLEPLLLAIHQRQTYPRASYISS